MNKIKELEEKIAVLEEIKSKKEIDEKTDLLAKDMSVPEKSTLIICMVFFISLFLILFYGLVTSGTPTNYKIANLLGTAWITACFIILDFCSFSSEKRRNYTVSLRIITACFILSGIYSFK